MTSTYTAPRTGHQATVTMLVLWMVLDLLMRGPLQ